MTSLTRKCGKHQKKGEAALARRNLILAALTTLASPALAKYWSDATRSDVQKKGTSSTQMPMLVSGRLVDAQGQPMTNIRLCEKTGTAFTISDADGRFFLELDGAAKHTLQFTVEGKAVTSGLPLPTKVENLQHYHDTQGTVRVSLTLSVALAGQNTQQEEPAIS